jgi:hypothetical protein
VTLSSVPSAGLEGSGLTAFVQYPDLASMFELRCLSIPNSDRSTFKELIDVVHDQIKVCLYSPCLFACFLPMYTHAFSLGRSLGTKCSGVKT